MFLLIGGFFYCQKRLLADIQSEKNNLIEPDLQ